ncbi:hypothetical protein DPMN_044925 [Dreissena polymorpha]|uniref:Uncharacterized protein n=1 Tax=Dreissena polymorpha TaxID=45954 RepID=A0A9D4HZE0_DREPO|nr:hypothetical protein DPMN_044925 [Dreissena polymorpha]
MIWLIVTFTVGFYTISRFGLRKQQILFDDVTTKQNQIWARKNKIADEEYALKKQKEREEKERHSS